MYQYNWDSETGGILLTTEQSKFSKEPRPVYFQELDILGFDKHWNYPKDDSAPLLWAEANNYIYKGRLVAKTKGGSLYTKPELILLEEPEPNNAPLQFVDIEKMCQKNKELMETLEQDTIKKIYNTYREYKNKIDIFYVAFSGGKDSIVALDLVQRALPHNDFKVVFGDTKMESPDTYQTINYYTEFCNKNNLQFIISHSKFSPMQSWNLFGPPSTSNRWCCSIHKTSPQIITLRKILGKHSFTGMAFTGVRAQESLSRSNYNFVNEGLKHTGQFSCHCLLNWASSEIFLYIYGKKLYLNHTYKLGNTRAGCLVCPNSSGKHDFIKHHCYQQNVDNYLNIIASTSNKSNLSKQEMENFIDHGYWRTRRSGKSLNMGQDLFEVNFKNQQPEIIVFKNDFIWQNWAKTIGNIIKTAENKYTITFYNILYQLEVLKKDNYTIFKFIDFEKNKQSIKLFSLFKSCIIKSLYCVGCGACEAECKYQCIDMKNEIVINDNCKHCYKCHDVPEHCFRYNSIRNVNSEKTMIEGKKINGYDGHGPRAEWLDIFIKYNGSAEFWNSDGDGVVPNKKKEKFKDFLKDAGLIVYDKNLEGDKFTKNKITTFGNIIIKNGAYSELSWALMLCNLAYTADYNWYILHLDFNTAYSSEMIKLLLNDFMPNDASGHGKANVINALKIAIAKTPLGTNQIFCNGDITIKTTSSGKETLTFNSIERSSWASPIPEVILYSLYKFAEACDNYYQFSLETLLDDSIERAGVSPTRIFGLDRETMIKILNGLSISYPEFISASFTLDLDNITLRDDKSSEDVLSLF